MPGPCCFTIIRNLTCTQSSSHCVLSSDTRDCAGKTTVVSPLVSLMIAHGDSLVVQCVPPSLLRMSIDVLRRNFSSSILQKAIGQFKCERKTKPTRNLVDQMRLLRQSGAVIVTTPAAIKAMLVRRHLAGLNPWSQSLDLPKA